MSSKVFSGFIFVALQLAVIVFAVPLFGQDPPDSLYVPSADTVITVDKAGFAFSLSGTTARRWGSTEYEIDVGRVMLWPSRKIVSTGSRLRFPTNPWLFGLTAAAEIRGFRFASTLWLSHTNARDVFKDYDWYELDGAQSSFIFGSATNDDALTEVDANVSYCARAGRLSFRPQLQFTFMRMKFDEESLEQTDYAGFDVVEDVVVLRYYAEPIDTDIPGAVLRYRIDYKIVYAGGTVGYSGPHGLGAEFTALFTPACWASDFDEHLLRDKESWASTNGTAGHIKFSATCRISSVIGFSGNVSYDFINTSGTQKQTMPDTETSKTVTYVGIPVRTKAEWMTAGLTMSFAIGADRD